MHQQPTDTTSQQGSEGKLTVAKRIQSSLKVMKQSSLGELTGSPVATLESLHSEKVTNVASSTFSEEKGAMSTRSSEHSKDQRSPPSHLPSTKQCCASDDIHVKNTTCISTNALSQEQSFTPMLLSPSEKHCSMQLSPSPQKLAAVSVSRLGGPVSMVGKLARSLSECDRKAFISELQQKTTLPMSSSSDIVVGGADIPRQNKEPNVVSQTPCTSNQALGTSDENNVIKSPHHKQMQSDTSTKKTESHHEVTKSTSTCTCIESRQGVPEAPLMMDGKKEKTVSAKEQALVEEQRALALLVERMEAEEIVAQMSRERMNSMLSEEEIAEVSYSSGKQQYPPPTHSLWYS